MKSFGELLPELGIEVDATAPIARVRPLMLCVGGCGLAVERRGAWCPACGRKDRAAMRHDELAAAYASLPNWPWARFTNPKFIEAVESKPGGKELLRAAFAWKASDGHLTIIGRTGVGKTAVITAIAHRGLDAVRDRDNISERSVAVAAGVRFISAVDLGDAARRWPPKDMEHPPLVQAALDAPILFLDDLGHEDPRDRSVFKVIDARYRSRDKTTIVTARLDRAQMEREDRYGKDGARRLFDGGVVVDLFLRGGA